MASHTRYSRSFTTAHRVQVMLNRRHSLALVQCISLVKRERGVKVYTCSRLVFEVGLYCRGVYVLTSVGL